MSKNAKAAMDNHSRQLNPKDATYWSSRAAPPPPAVAPLTGNEAPPAQRQTEPASNEKQAGK